MQPFGALNLAYLEYSVLSLSDILRDGNVAIEEKTHSLHLFPSHYLDERALLHEMDVGVEYLQWGGSVRSELLKQFYLL